MKKQYKQLTLYDFIMVVLETDRQLVRKIFTDFPKRYRGRNPVLQNVYDYYGKHILEFYRKEGYMSRYEFRELMDDMEIRPFKNSYTYPLRIDPKYYVRWA